jgi:hypothetical protein
VQVQSRSSDVASIGLEARPLRERYQRINQSIAVVGRRRGELPRSGSRRAAAEVVKGRLAVARGKERAGHGTRRGCRIR